MTHFSFIFSAYLVGFFVVSGLFIKEIWRKKRLIAALNAMGV
jgi:hypothetical protein